VACTLSILAFLLKGWLSEDSVRLAGRHKDLANGAAVFREIVYYDDNEDFGLEEKASHNSRNSKGVPVNPNNQIDITVNATGPSEDEKIRRFQSAILAMVTSMKDYTREVHLPAFYELGQ